MLDFEFPSIDGLIAEYPDARAAIADGNYELASKLAADAEDDELAALAILMAGGIRQGLTRLERLTAKYPETALYAAFGEWCRGRPDEALARLATVSDTSLRPLADGLARFIARKSFSVIVVADENNARGAPLAPGQEFDVAHLSAQDARAILAATIPANPPPYDLLLAYDSADAALLDAASRCHVPSVVLSTDFDQRFGELHDVIERADLVLGGTALEHAIMSNLSGARVAAYPGVTFREHRGEIVRPSPGKDIDIFCSGTNFVPHWPDKARFMYRLASLDDPALAIRIHHGYLPDGAYRALMRRTKYIPLTMRFGFSLNQDRTTEALHYGCGGLTIGGVDAAYLLGDSAALLAPVGAAAEDGDIAAIVQDYEERIGAVDWNACSETIADFYPPPPERDARLLKFVLFQTLFPRARETRKHRPDSLAPRLALSQASADRFAEFIAAPLDPSRQDALLSALDAEGAADAAAIPPRFNRARILWMIGRRAEAVDGFRTVSNMPDGPFAFHPADFALPHRVRALSALMPYQAYYQGMVLDSMKDAPFHPRVHAVVRASCLTYLALDHSQNGRFDEGAQHAAQAWALCHCHHPAAWQLTKASFAAGWPPQRVLDAFLAATGLYPPLLDDLLPIGADAMKRLALDDLAETYVRKWLYAVSRITYSDPEPGRPPRQTLECAMQYLQRLPDRLKMTLKSLMTAA